MELNRLDANLDELLYSLYLCCCLLRDAIVVGLLIFGIYHRSFQGQAIDTRFLVRLIDLGQNDLLKVASFVDSIDQYVLVQFLILFFPSAILLDRRHLDSSEKILPQDPFLVICCRHF